MDFDFKLALDVIWKAGTLIGFVWMYLANRDLVTNTRIGKLETDIEIKLDDHAIRLTRLEADVEKSPTHDDVGKLYDRIRGLETRLSERIETVGGAVKRIEGENAAQTRILNLLYENQIKP